MLSISGYGRTGRRSSYAAYATNISNHVGLSSAWGHTHGYHFDYVAGYHGALGVLAALRQAEATGTGVHLDLAQVESGATVMMPILVEHLATGAAYQRRDNVVPGSVLSAVVACAGADRWLAVEAVDGADWERLCGVARAPGATADPSAAERRGRRGRRSASGPPPARRTRRPTCCSGPAWRRRRCRTRPTSPAIRSCGRAASSWRSITRTSVASSTRVPWNAPCSRAVA